MPHSPLHQKWRVNLLLQCQKRENKRQSGFSSCTRLCGWPQLGKKCSPSRTRSSECVCAYVYVCVYMCAVHIPVVRVQQYYYFSATGQIRHITNHTNKPPHKLYNPYIHIMTATRQWITLSNFWVFNQNCHCIKPREKEVTRIITSNQSASPSTPAKLQTCGRYQTSSSFSPLDVKAIWVKHT